MSRSRDSIKAPVELVECAELDEAELETPVPKHLNERVARLHLKKLGVKLTQLSKDQADYIGVPLEGPYKPDHYRY